MPKCAFLSTDHLEDFYVYDMMAQAPLAALGWDVIEVSWHDSEHDWDQYDVVVVRSTWDYQQHEKDFMACLARIEASTAHLENPLALMQWNISKQYLQALESKGVNIVPTIWNEDCNLDVTQGAFKYFDTEEIVIKPYVSANADFTYRLTKAQLAERFDTIQTEYQNRSMMIQPFLNSIINDGEYSLFYFSGQYSHAICKRPASGDFRVQEEHGGQLSTIQPSEAMQQLGSKTMQALPCDALYARVDMVEIHGKLAIIEVELIEPSLYFNMDEQSPARFAAALASKYG